VNPDGSAAARWFSEECTTLFATVLESLSGERPKLACAPAEAATLPAAAEAIAGQHGAIWWWEQQFPLPGEPAVWIGAPQNAWSQLAARVLGEEGGEQDAQARETYVEILQQTMGELARSAGRRWNRQIDAPGKEAAAAPPAGEFYQLNGTYSDAQLPPLLIVVTGNPQEPPGPEDAPVAASTAESAPQPQSRTFDLLMGVELPVSVSFGHVQLPLKDVLKLAAGSIIELNRTVDEPVEVIVNNCVVARGEVVVVEGNYGVRIHQIMSRQERLENLP
jgi:flagellar motor switch protein FliN/FliY